MKIAVFSTRRYDRAYLAAANISGHELSFFESNLTPATIPLTVAHDAVCVFVNDDINATVIQSLAANGVELILTRSAGFNHIDLDAAAKHKITVARVPAYSPEAVAEHTVALILSLNRKTHRAYNRVREQNFSLEGLAGFDLRGKTVGIIGTGKIGRAFARIMNGFGCELLAFDPFPHPEVTELGARYVELDELFASSRIVSLHCPLTPETHHLIDDSAIERMPDGVMLINTSRGALVDTPAVIRGLKNSKIGSLGLDVYEEEADMFFQDLSDKVLQDDVFARLLTFPNVLITAHQAFFTDEALTRIAETTLENASHFEAGTEPVHRAAYGK